MSCLNTSQGLDRVSIVVSQAGQGILKPQRIVPQFSWSRPKSQHAWKKTHNSGISPQIWVLTPHSSGYSAARLRLLPHSTQKGEKLSFLSLLCSFVGVTGFEPATSSSRTKRATKLRHTPRNSHIVGRPSVNLKITCLDFGGCHTKIRPETRKSHLEVKIRIGNYRGRARRPLPVARATIPAATPPRRGANFPAP